MTSKRHDGLLVRQPEAKSFPKPVSTFRDRALNRPLIFDRDVVHQAPFLVAEIGAHVEQLSQMS